MVDSSPAPPLGGRIADRFVLDTLLGEGAHGRTWRGRDERTGAAVAVKELSLKNVRDWKAVELFEREARVLRQLRHPGVPAYVDAPHATDPVTGEEHFFLVQSLVDGEDLGRTLAREGRWAEAEVRRMLHEVLEVLRDLQRMAPPILHRDLKPSNLMRRRDGRYAVIDFGGVQSLVPNAGGTTVVGTSGYMPVEQLMGRATPASDIYALGATAIHLLSGIHPATMELDRFRLRFAPHVSVSPALLAYLTRMVEPEPSDRFPDAAAALHALETLDTAMVPRATPPATAAPGLMIGAGAIALLAMIVGVSVIVVGAVDDAEHADRDQARAAAPFPGGVTTSEERERDIPVQWSDLTGAGLVLERHHSWLEVYDASAWYKMNGILRNTGTSEIEMMRGRIRLGDANGTPLHERGDERWLDTHQATLRPGDTVAFHALVPASADVRTATLEVTRATQVPAAPSYPPATPISFDAGPTAARFAIAMRSRGQDFTGGAPFTFSRVTLEVENTGGPPIRAMQLLIHYQRDGHPLPNVEPTPLWVVSSSDPPMLPEDIRLVSTTAQVSAETNGFRVEVVRVE